MEESEPSENSGHITGPFVVISFRPSFETHEGYHRHEILHPWEADTEQAVVDGISKLMLGDNWGPHVSQLHTVLCDFSSLRAFADYQPSERQPATNGLPLYVPAMWVDYDAEGWEEQEAHCERMSSLKDRLEKSLKASLSDATRRKEEAAAVAKAKAEEEHRARTVTNKKKLYEELRAEFG